MPWWDLPAKVAGLVGVGGLAYRAVLVVLGVPATNSDEATMGLAALHISQGRDFPAFFYGQSYMGTLEAYLAAPLFWLFGPTTVALRLPTLLLYGVFVVGMFALTRLIVGPWPAVVTVAVLALGSDRIVKNQLIAAGGYPEISPGAAVLFLLATLLGLGLIPPRRRTFMLWGLISGLLFWTHWLILPYLGVAGLVLIAAARKNRNRMNLGSVAWATVLGFVVGSLPLLVYNLSSPFSSNSVGVFLSQNASAADSSLADKIYGGVLLGIPMGVGLCSPGRCETWHLLWSFPYLVALLVAGFIAVKGLRQGADEGFRNLVRLGLVAAAGTTVLAYARSSSAAETPVESARYLSPLLVSTPVLLWLVWTLAARLVRLGEGRNVSTARRRLFTLAVTVPAGAVLAVMAVATSALALEVPAIREAEERRDSLAEYLLAQGSRYVYADYWTCNRLTFRAREEIRCAVLNDDLTRGHDRYAPYRRAVESSANPVYVVPESLPLDGHVRAALDTSGVAYRVSRVAGHNIYVPARPLPIPS
ncbi:hypothetical protein GCM10010429_04430 [Micromonospora olivasterospora]